MNSSPAVCDKPIPGTAADVSAISTLTTVQSEHSFFSESQSENGVTQNILAYEVPEHLKSKMNDDSINVQEFMNKMADNVL